MRDRKKHTATNIEIDLPADALADLPVPDELASQSMAGGYDAQGRLLIATESGIWRG